MMDYSDNPASKFGATLRDSKPLTLAVKRAMDVVVAAALLALVAPVILIAAGAVKLTTPGPIMFAQRRLGRLGTIFTVFKLRTMVDGAWRQGLSVREGDARITSVGRILRACHIDELPQLINVLRGDMSLVGPRPALPFHFDYYEEWEYERLAVRPGITGIAQVQLGNRASWDERIVLDVQYVRKLSISRDLGILFLTLADLIAKIVLRRSTYQARNTKLWTRGFPENLFTNRLYEQGR